MLWPMPTTEYRLQRSLNSLSPWRHAFGLWQVAVPLPSRAEVHANWSEVTTVKQHRKFPRVVKAGRWVLGALEEYVLDNWRDNFRSGSWGQAWASFPHCPQSTHTHTQSEPLICPSFHHHNISPNCSFSLAIRPNFWPHSPHVYPFWSVIALSCGVMATSWR